MTLRTEVEHWPLATPFRIAGHAFEMIEMLVVYLEENGHLGRGEAAGVYYRNDAPAYMQRQIELLRTEIEAGLTRASLQNLVPAGGARNALDCALWDLEAKRTGQAVWQLAGLEEPRALLTTFTCGADDPQRMAEAACAYSSARAIKLKLTGEPLDVVRVREVRSARPDVWLCVDANQGFTRESFEKLMPALVETHVAMIEQPFPMAEDWLLDGIQSPIPIAADESVQTLSDIPSLAGRFNIVNIKLDKCGGLTEGLAMARAAHTFGLDTMVGNMLGTSLAMAPAYLVGQLCQVVDLDGPILLGTDRPHGVQYADGFIKCPEGIWGSSESAKL